MNRASSSPFQFASRFRLQDVEERQPTAMTARAAVDLSITDATELLDWLEGNGLRVGVVELTPTGRMTVRWME